MCYNRKMIFNRYTNKSIYVDCGYCPACQQRKAISRTNRIRNHINNDGSILPLFVTLTYSNDYVPYIRRASLRCSPVYRDDYNVSSLNAPLRRVPIYRLKDVRWFKGKKVVNSHRHILSYVDIPTSYLKDVNSLPLLRGSSIPRIGVCYYKDLQNFIKRLRINLNLRNENNFSFYACSEYGPTTVRPHFHLLLFVPNTGLEMWKRAISAAWPYDGNDRTYNSVEIARDAASYVSSYVNCSSSVPSLFRSVREISPRHSYSKGFGVGYELFSLPSLAKAFGRRDLRYAVQRIVDGASTNVPLLLPKYVINRHFPQFKGFNSLTNDARFAIALRPETLRNFAYQLGYNDLDFHTVYVQLCNCKQRALSFGISSYDFARMYSEIWNIRASQSLIFNYQSIINLQDNVYAYDNIKQYYDSMVLSESLDSLRSELDFTILDPNQFPKAVHDNFVLSDAFHSYSKDRKIRNFIYSKTLNV